MLHRDLVLQVEHLRVQCDVFRSRVPGRIRFTDEERRSLVAAGLAMGRRAMRAVETIVKPDSSPKWNRKLEQRKWAYCPKTGRV